MRWISSLLIVLAAGCGDDSPGATDGPGTTDSPTGTEGTQTTSPTDGDVTTGGTDSSSDGGTDTAGTGSTGGTPADVDRYEPVFLPGARAGVAYASMLPSASTYELVEGDVPPGLSLDPATGTVTGTPDAEGIHEFTVSADTSGEIVGFDVQLPVYPSDESGITTTDDPSLPGPFEVSRTIVTIPSATVSTGTWSDIEVLVTHPATQADGDTLPDGPFPLIAFHHAAHTPPDIFDDYGELHEHWASHG